MLAPMSRALPRRGTADRAVGAVCLVLVTAGCGGIGQPGPYNSTGIDGLVIPTPSPQPADFVDDVDNPWLPLVAGNAWRYRVTARGRTVGRIRVEVLTDREEVAGLTTTAVRSRDAVRGEDPVTRTRLYAQDTAGNVWLVGEDSDGGPGPGNWRAGQDGAQAGLAMPAEPRLGDGWLASAVPGRTEDRVRVLGRAPVTTDEDAWPDTVETTQEADNETRRYYASGVGVVRIEDLTSGTRADLVDHGSD